MTVTAQVERLSSELAGRYTIERELGQGGMATVYLAEDARHHRQVALKVLRPEIATSIGAARFLREIEIAARLTHPHILPLHDSGEADGLLYYVMPFVQGESLRDRLLRVKQLPIEDAVLIAREVADALSFAHEQGVVHRDIKPENILFEAGHAVVSDFGIAHAVDAAGGGGLTETGLAIGTPAYMSPEQAAGVRDVDARSDLYSLGCVLYEMLAGEPPFTGPTAQVIMARRSVGAIPSLRTCRDSVSEALEAVVYRALARVPADRYASTAVFAAALSAAANGASVSGMAAARTTAHAASQEAGPRVRLRRALWLVPAGVVLAAGVVLLRGWRNSPPAAGPAPVTVSTIVLPSGAPMAFIGTASYGTGRTALALSPDGGVLVYAAQLDSGTQLYRRPMDRDTAFPIAGTEGACCPFFSPDGAGLGFIVGDRMKKVRVDIGGQPMPVTNVRGFNAADWGDDGWIVFSDMHGNRSARVNAATGVREVMRPALSMPKVLPGARAILTSRRDDALGATVGAVVPGRHERLPLLTEGSDARFVPTGHVTYTLRGELWAVPFDPGSLRATGEPFVVVSNLRTEAGWGMGQYAFSRSGVMVYAQGGQAGHTRLVVRHRNGRVEALPFDPAPFGCLDLSPDGTRIAAGVFGQWPGLRGVWIYDLVERTSLRLALVGGCPVWSPEGDRVAYTVRDTLGSDLVVQDVSGRTSPVVLRSGDGRISQPSSWSRDGTRLALTLRGGDSTVLDVGVLELDSGAIRIVAQGPALEWGGVFSPDGRWIAYTAIEEEHDEVYVQAYPFTGQRWRVTLDGGETPLWTRGGRELVYRNRQEWWAVPVTMTPRFTAGEPVLLASGPYAQTSSVESAISADGERLYLLESAAGPSTTMQLTVVTNFFSMLQDRSRRAQR